MSSAAVNSILARCMTDTAFLEHLANDPRAALTGYDLDEQTRSDFMKLEVGRLRSFAGLIVKVQNNGLWQFFPYTRKLMVHHGIDLDVFVAYRAQHLENRSERVPQKVQIARFLSFLDEYLDSQQVVDYPFLRDILAHEKTIWRLRADLDALGDQAAGAGGEAADVASLRYDDLMSCAPVIHGMLRLVEMGCDPSEIISDLDQPQFEPEQHSFQKRWLAYWVTGTARSLRILQVDRPIASFLSHADGRRSVRAIIRRVVDDVAAGFRLSEFRPFLKLAVKERLLSLKGRRGVD